MSKKYNCDLCKYATDRQYDYTKHLGTKKHVSNATTNHLLKIGSNKPKNGSNVSLVLTCEYCNKSISHKNHIKRHYKCCVKYKEYVLRNNNNYIINELEIKLKNHEKQLKKKDENMTQLQNELKKKDNELKEQMCELRDIEKEYMDFMRSVAKNGTNVTNIQNVNMYFVIRTYIKAKNYEDLMNAPLTDDEINGVMKHGGVEGGYMILYKRCIEGLELKDRPFHCVDDSRNKYMLRTGDKWHIDKQGGQLMEGIYPRLLQLCIPKEISNADEIDDWKKENARMNEIANGKNKILKRLNKVALLKNNVKQIK